jgi:hypothetical protein
MAVEMVGIGWPPRGAHGDQRKPGRDNVEAGVCGFADDAEAAGEEADDELADADHRSDEE